MADIADLTTDRMEAEEQLRQRQRQRQRNVSEDCVECGEEIPQARQQATGGTDTCIMCQERREIMQRTHR